MRTAPEQPTVIAIHPCLVSVDDSVYPLYVSLRKTRRATSLLEEADKNLVLVQKRQKRHHDHHV